LHLLFVAVNQHFLAYRAFPPVLGCLVDSEEPGKGSINIMSTMRTLIRRLRAEGLQRLRTGRCRINLSTGDRDDVDGQVDQLLRKAEAATHER
jgi:hypothetical protein